MLQIISLFNYLFMAKQAGDYFIEGTFDDLTFYKMCGRYYVRMKTSLTGKRFWKDKAFEGSRKSCSRFGEGNTLASTVFQLVREENRTNRLFPFLRTRSIALLKEGKAAEEVVCLLLDYLVDFGFIEIEGKQKGDGLQETTEHFLSFLNFEDCRWAACLQRTGLAAVAVVIACPAPNRCPVFF